MYRSEEEKKKLSALRRNFTDFFIEVVSRLCFGQSSAPEDELIKMLLDIVFTEPSEVEEGGEGEGERCGTRNLTPFKDTPGDKQPVIRSFLLQLLLEHEYVGLYFLCLVVNFSLTFILEQDREGEVPPTGLLH